MILASLLHHIFSHLAPPWLSSPLFDNNVPTRPSLPFSCSGPFVPFAMMCLGGFYDGEWLCLDHYLCT